MIFTLYYMYATIIQWWRLGQLKNKLNGTLNSQNALLVCSGNVISDTRRQRSLENLLFHNEDRIGCTVVPKQKVNLSQWINFPKNCRYFPILFNDFKQKIQPPYVYVLIQALLETYTKHESEIIQVENFGELLAWKVGDHFEAILKTDIDNLTKLVHCFSQNSIDINHELKLLRIETVDIECSPVRIKYERAFSFENTLKYSYTTVYWRRFVEDLKELYAKIRDTTNPKITIENGTSKIEENKKVPVSEVKPIKKECNKKLEDKNTLEVSHTSEHRRHKNTDHKRDKSSCEKQKTKEEKKSHSPKSKDKEETSKDCQENGREQTSNITDVQAKEITEQLPHQQNVRSKTKDKNATVEAAKRSKSRDKVESSGSNTKLQNGTPSSGAIPKEFTKNNIPIIKENGKKIKDKRDTKPREKSSEKHPKKSSKDKSSARKSEKARKLSTETFAATVEIPDNQLVNSIPGETLPHTEEHEGNCGINKNGGKGVKPPNVLVYADSLVAKDNVKAVLYTMLNREKYTIYDLPVNTSVASWSNSTVLVIVCGTVPPNLTPLLLQYLVTGGQLLCLCSDLLYSVLHTFTTAEVREHELVRFSYGEWKQVKMMHHIFCYQASPAKKQFSKDSDHSNPSSGNGSSPIFPRTPSTVDIQHNGRDYTIKVQVLGTEETWQTPSLLLARVKGSEGKAVFSQVHLEIHPTQYQDDETKYEALRNSNQARLEILKDILCNHLDIDCNATADVEYTPAYFLGRHDLKLKMMADCGKIVNNKLDLNNISLTFCGKDVVYEQPTSMHLPVLIHACPSNFSTVHYFEALETERIGRLVIYSDVLTSSQHILKEELAHGLVVIVRQQTNGVGRSNNVWLSPLGSALFSVQLHIPLDSPFGRALPLVQHLIMVAIVSAIKNIKGCQDLSLGIKWPNDLYVDGNVKIGGSVVSSTILKDAAYLTAGVGVNLDNSNPTTCINDLIKTYNIRHDTNIKPIQYETYFALVFNEIERLYKIVQEGDLDYFYDIYYKYWLHGNSSVTINNADGTSRKVKITGIDEFGYLKVRSEDGTLGTVQPDGNTFDMMKGLIAPKNF